MVFGMAGLCARFTCGFDHQILPSAPILLVILAQAFLASEHLDMVKVHALSKWKLHDVCSRSWLRTMFQKKNILCTNNKQAEWRPGCSRLVEILSSDFLHADLRSMVADPWSPWSQSGQWWSHWAQCASGCILKSNKETQGNWLCVGDEFKVERGVLEQKQTLDGTGRLHYSPPCQQDI